MILKSTEASAQGPREGPTSHCRWLTKTERQQGFVQNPSASRGLIWVDFWGSILGSCAWEEGEAEPTWGPQVPSTPETEGRSPGTLHKLFQGSHQL